MPWHLQNKNAKDKQTRNLLSKINLGAEKVLVYVGRSHQMHLGLEDLSVLQV